MPARASGFLAALAAVVLAASAAPAAARGRHDRGPVARTDTGLVRGLHADGVEKFLGIPYAAPPVGARRWRPPAPAAPWSGVRATTTLPPACAQLTNSNGPRSESEDCLYLSVYRPRHTPRRRRLPVLFWIHGGGFDTGSGNQHDGALLAQSDHLVVVSINYRLGIFGFLALGSLGGDTGDFGLLDQQAAMGWTARNVAAFGGDPGNVTIAGESAGGMSVCAALASPTARGLFARAVMQSGSCTSQPAAEAEQGGEAFARAAGCPDPATAAACLRAKPAGALLDVTPAPDPTPAVGGAVLPVAPQEAVEAGRFSRVPLIIGDNRDEGRTFAQGFTGYTEQQYTDFVRSLYGDRAGAILARYPWSAYPSPYTAAYAIGAIWTDSGFLAGIGGCATQALAHRFARATPTFAYEFHDRHAPGLNQDHPGYAWGAGHAMELAYMWPSFDNGIPLYPQLTPPQRELSRQMVRYWGAFAWSGVPRAAGQPRWPQDRRGRVLSLRPGDRTVAISDARYAAEHQCGFWNDG